MARKSRKKENEYLAVPHKVWQTALYARISRKRAEHESIETQIEEVKQYIEKRPHFKLVEVYSDDGWSGSNFNRPDFDRLMEDIRNRHIDCIIVKDLSRFAREHIGAEDYLNNIFPFLGVRFIAINDNYDNINIEPQEYFLAAFKNLANAHFASETSRKVSTAKKILQEQGKFIGSKPPYGYKRDPADKHKLIADEQTAPIVIEIFHRYADGESPAAICADLNERKLKKVLWTSGRLNNILRRETYIGTLIQRMSTQALYKNEAIQRVPKEEQMRVENAVPPLIDIDLWNRVHERINARIPARINPEAPDNIYRSYLFCGRCNCHLSGSYTGRKANSYFYFRCIKCTKQYGIRTNGKTIDEAVREQFALDENSVLTREFIINNIDKIVINKADVTVVPKGGDTH